MIRPTELGDSQALLNLAQRTGVFKAHEIQALGEVLADYHATNKRLDHVSVTYEEHGEILGFAYYAPASMTDRTWYLYWIAVTKQTQARGIGSKLLTFAEDDVRAKRGRMLLIETSSLPAYAPTHQFYRKHQYHQAAKIADFYADNDDLVVYCKKFEEQDEG